MDGYVAAANSPYTLLSLSTELLHYYILNMILAARYGSNALILGASEGIGAAYCEELAAAGINLWIVARRIEPLEALAKDLIAKYKVAVNPISVDLNSDAALERLKEKISTEQIDILVYNAALSYIGPQLETPITTHTSIAQINIVTLLKVVQHFAPAMLKRGRGAMILMSSIAGFQGAGFIATYAASKAFIRVLAEGLWYEWRGKGVDIISCCAGATATPGYLNTKPKALSIFAPKVQEPREVVTECLSRLGTVPSFVTGGSNKLATFFMNKIFSRKQAVSIMGDSARKMYDIKY